MHEHAGSIFSQSSAAILLRFYRTHNNRAQDLGRLLPYQRKLLHSSAADASRRTIRRRGLPCLKFKIGDIIAAVIGEALALSSPPPSESLF